MRTNWNDVVKHDVGWLFAVSVHEEGGCQLPWSESRARDSSLPTLWVRQRDKRDRHGQTWVAEHGWNVDVRVGVWSARRG